MSILEQFINIRNIAFTIPLSLNDEDCCCSGKHTQLKALFESEEIRTRYRVCSYLRSSMKLPSNLSEVPHEDYSTHVYLEIKVNNQRIIVDATRDLALKNILPTNTWDGQSNTTIAVPPLEIFSPEKSLEIMTNEDNEEILSDLEKNGKFYHAFNKRLAEERLK